MTNTTTKTTRAKTITTSREIPSITLSSIIRDIYANNANATITDKKMRARLRVMYRDEHVHNTSWVFTQSRAHDVRMIFDDAYRAKFERAQKRVTPKRVASKRVAKTNDVATNDEGNDDNA